MSAEKTLLAGIGSALTIAGSITKATNGPRVLLAKLGWDLPPGVDDIGLAALDLARVGTHLTEWSDLASNPEAATEDQEIALAQLADAVIDVIDELSDLRLEAPQEYLDRTRIKDEFLTRLLDFYLIQSTAIASPPVFDIAVLLGWFELQRLDADPTKFQVKHIRHTVRWDRVPKLFTDPTGLFRETYGWGTPTFNPDTLVIRVGAVLQHIAAEVRHRQLPEIPLARMHGGPLAEHPPQLQLLLPLLGSAGPLSGETGISVFGLPPTTPGGADGGLGLAPYAERAATIRFPLSSIISLGMSAKADLGSGIALVFRPDKDPVLHTDLNKAQAGTAGAGGEVNLDLTLAMPNGASPMTLISAGGAKVEAKSVAVSVGALVDTSRTDATVRLEIKGGRLTVKPEDLPFLGPSSDEGLVVDADVDLSWSHQHGVRLGGRAELKISKTIGRSIGPVSIDLLQIVLATSDSGLSLTAGLNVSVKIGPLLLIVDQIGVRSAITPGPGSLGSADLTIRPVPPSGIGLEVKAPGVVGGGFLRFDFQKHEYSGILQLEVAETIAVKAVGLLTTRMPDGSKGFSLVVIVTAEGFAPIQLGLGFTLTGIGGLLGINRTVSVDVLRGGLKNGTLGSIMFPPDPIRNAPQIVSDLRTGFPPVKGRHVFGPMATICWGTPTILTLELALILELPEPVRLIILGRLKAILPDERAALVQVRMDAVGVIDFNKGEVSLDATLYDSRILEFVLTGDMALRASWGAQSSFLLAVGGFNPRFLPPAGFPKLNRVALNLSQGDDLRLQCAAYLALTSNTAQFGARITLHAAGGGFTVDGYLGVDALFQFTPFSFVVDISAGVAVRYHGHLLMGISLDGTLSGPTPWHVKGKASFDLLFFSVSISVDHRFGRDEPAELPAAVDVLGLLIAAVNDARNWSSELPRGEHPLVTFREPTDTTTLRAHPLAVLTVRQRVVPLNMTIDTFGNAPVSGTNRFTLEPRRADGSAGELPLSFNVTQDSFGVAQFLRLRDDERLSRPSFESKDAGLRFGSDEVDYHYDPLLDADVEYETQMVVPGQEEKPPSLPVYVMRGAILDAVVINGAAGQAPLRRTGNARYRTIALAT